MGTECSEDMKQIICKFLCIIKVKLLNMYILDYIIMALGLNPLLSKGRRSLPRESRTFNGSGFLTKILLRDGHTLNREG